MALTAAAQGLVSHAPAYDAALARARAFIWRRSLRAERQKRPPSAERTESFAVLQEGVRSFGCFCKSFKHLSLIHI